METATETDTCNPNQVFDPETAGNKTITFENMSANDMDTEKSIEELLNGALDNILKPYDTRIAAKIPGKVQSQTDINSATTNTVTEHSEDLQSDAVMMDSVKSYLESLSAEQLMAIIPKERIMSLITPYFRQLTNIKCLTSLLEKMPKDLKQRVI